MLQSAGGEEGDEREVIDAGSSGRVAQLPPRVAIASALCLSLPFLDSILNARCSSRL